MNWTDGQTAFLVVLVLMTLLTFFGDVYTTMVGMEHGFVEANPIQKFLFKKLGQQFAAFVSIVGVLALGGTIAAHQLGAGYLFFGIVSTLEGVRTVLNYLKLKKTKISLK